MSIRIIRRLLIAVFLLASIPAVLYLGSTELLEFLVFNRLEALGCNNIQCHIKRPNSEKIFIPKLSFIYQSNFGKLNVNIDSLSLGYDLNDISSWRLGAIHARTVSVEVKPNLASQTVKTPSFQPSFAALPYESFPSQVFINLPFKNLKLDKIDLSLPKQGHHILASMDLQAGATKHHLKTIVATPEGSLTAKISLARSGSLTLDVLSPKDQTSHIFRFQGVEQSDSSSSVRRILFDTSLNVDSLGTVFKTAIPNKIEFSGLSGVLHASGSIPQAGANSRMHVDISSNIHISSLKYDNKFTSHNIALSGDFKANIGENVFEFSSNRPTSLSLRKIEAKGLILSSLKLNYLTSFSYNFQDQKGDFSSKILPIKFSQKDPFRTLYSRQKNKIMISLMKGSIEGSLLFPIGAKSAPSKSRLSLKARDISGTYQDIPFSGLGAKLKLNNLFLPRTSRPIKITLKNLNPGFPIKNISLKVDILNESVLQSSQLQVGDIKAELLGGRLHCHRVSTGSNTSHQLFMVNLKALDLETILALQQQEPVSAKGLLDGTFPVSVGPDGLRISGGHLSARSPGGTISYLPNPDQRAYLSSNPGLDLALSALKNFNYNKLNMSFNYTPNGTLRTSLSISGKNPEFQQGQTINLNLNLEQNVLTLLRSLRIGSNISDKLQKFHDPSTR